MHSTSIRPIRHPPSLPPAATPSAPLTTLRRRDLLGGLIHEYQLAA